MIIRALCLLLLPLFLSNLSVVAQPKPIDEPPPRTGGRSGGSRGCDSTMAIAPNSPPALILLIPTQPQTKTTLTRPTFAWFVRDTRPQAMVFRLYRYRANQPNAELMQEIEAVSQPGITVFSRPSTVAALQVGGHYLWQVELLCNPNRPSSNLYAEGEFQVVTGNSELMTRLKATTDPTEQIRLYTAAGLWYDALNKGFKLEQAQIQNPKLKAMRRLLLQQVALEPGELEWLDNSQINVLQR